MALKLTGLCAVATACLCMAMLPGASVPANEAGAQPGNCVSSGFVFYDGRYVEAPYCVERVGLTVHINGTQVTPEPFIRPNLIVEEDPGVPPGLTKESTIGDFMRTTWKDRLPYYNAKLAYLWRTRSNAEAQELMLAYFRSLPFAKEVTRVEGDGARLIDYKGNALTFDIYLPDFALTPPPTEAELEQEVERLAGIYREGLAKDDCFFFFSAGAELVMAGRKAVNVLPEMERILTDQGKTDTEKAADLLTIGLFPEHDVTLASIAVSNFERTEQFDSRLEALRSAIIQKYGKDAVHTRINGEPSGERGGK